MGRDSGREVALVVHGTVVDNYCGLAGYLTCEVCVRVMAALTRVEAETLERAARHVEAMTNGMTCMIVTVEESRELGASAFDGVMTQDVDGPWFLKQDIAQAIRALAPEPSSATPDTNAPSAAARP